MKEKCIGLILLVILTTIITEPAFSGESGDSTNEGCTPEIQAQIDACQSPEKFDSAVSWFAAHPQNAKVCLREALVSYSSVNWEPILKAYLMLKDEKTASTATLIFFNKAKYDPYGTFFPTFSSYISAPDLLQMMALINYPIDGDIFQILQKRGGPEETKILRDYLTLTGSPDAAQFLGGLRDKATLSAMNAYWYKQDDEFVNYFFSGNEPEISSIVEALKAKNTNLDNYNKKISLSGLDVLAQMSDAKLMAYLRPTIINSELKNDVVTQSRVFPNAPFPVEKYFEFIRHNRSWVVQRTMVLGASLFFPEKKDLNQLMIMLLKVPTLNPWVRAAACEKGFADNPEMTPLLVERLEDQDALVRVCALKSLSSFKGYTEVSSVIVEMYLNGSSLFEREAARDFLASRLPNDSAVQALLKGMHYDLEKDEGPNTRNPEGFCDLVLRQDDGNHPELTETVLNIPRMSELRSIHDILAGGNTSKHHHKFVPTGNSLANFFSMNSSNNRGVKNESQKGTPTSPFQPLDFPAMTKEMAVSILINGDADLLVVNNACGFLIHHGNEHDVDVLTDHLMKDETLKHPVFIILALYKLDSPKFLKTLCDYVRIGKKGERDAALKILKDFKEYSFTKEERQKLEERLSSDDEKIIDAAPSEIADKKAADFNDRLQLFEKALDNTNENNRKYLYARTLIYQEMAIHYQETGEDSPSVFNRGGPPEYLSVVYEALKNHSVDKRMNALDILSDFGTEESVKILSLYLHDPNPQIRIMVWFDILKLSDKFGIQTSLPNDVEDLNSFRDRLERADSVEEWQILDVLGFLKSPLAIPFLSNLIPKASPNRILEHEIKYLSCFDTPETNQILFQLAVLKENQQAFEGLDKNNGDFKIKAIQEILKKPDSNKIYLLKKRAIQMVCQENLQSLGEFLLPCIFSKFSDYSQGIDCLSNLSFPGKGKELIKLFDKTINNQDNAIQILSFCRNMDDPDEVILMKKALKDGRPKVRQEAEEIIADNASDNDDCFEVLRISLKIGNLEIKNWALQSLRELSQSGEPEAQKRMKQLDSNELKLIGTQIDN